MSSWYPMLLLLAVTIYCAVQAVLDYRRKRYAFAAIGAALAIGLFTVPIPTHAVKIDLPAR